MPESIDIPTGILRVEVIRLPGTVTEEYRINLLNFPGMLVTATATREQYLVHGYEPTINRIINELSSRMACHIQSACERELTDLYRNTGILDNTAVEHRPDPRAAAPPRPLTVEEYGGSFAIPRGSINGNQIQRLVEQQQRAAMQAAYAELELPSEYQRIFAGHHEPDKEYKKKEKASKAILLKKIGRKKYKQLTKRGYFEETGKNGLFRFHLNKSGGATFIQTIQCGSKKTRQLEWSLCIQSSDSNLPKYDVILSRWIAWKADEDDFLNTANFRNVGTIDEAVSQRVAVENRIFGGW